MAVVVVTRMFASEIVDTPLRPIHVTTENAATFLQWAYAITDSLRVVSLAGLLIAIARKPC